MRTKGMGLNERKIFEMSEAQRNERGLHGYVEWFVREYAPEDRHEMARFHADLMHLVHRIYEVAQAPMIKQMSDAMGFALAQKPIFPKG
jgi:hypothetical protein